MKVLLAHRPGARALSTRWPDAGFPSALDRCDASAWQRTAARPQSKSEVAPSSRRGHGVGLSATPTHPSARPRPPTRRGPDQPPPSPLPCPACPPRPRPPARGPVASRAPPAPATPKPRARSSLFLRSPPPARGRRRRGLALVTLLGPGRRRRRWGRPSPRDLPGPPCSPEPPPAPPRELAAQPPPGAHLRLVTPPPGALVHSDCKSWERDASRPGGRRGPAPPDPFPLDANRPGAGLWPTTQGRDRGVALQQGARGEKRSRRDLPDDQRPTPTPTRRSKTPALPPPSPSRPAARRRRRPGARREPPSPRRAEWTAHGRRPRRLNQGGRALQQGHWGGGGEFETAYRLKPTTAWSASTSPRG
jgi:hypothetical protein